MALHAGSSLIGNIGSGQHFHYGMVGNLMNAAARVESLTKYYGVLLILTREVYAKLSAPPPSRVLDHVIVKGKSTPLELLEIEHPLNSAGFKRVAAEYGAAFAFHRREEFPEAARRFATLAASDRPSAVMAKRCSGLSANPPADWAGIFTMEDK